MTKTITKFFSILAPVFFFIAYHMEGTGNGEVVLYDMVGQEVQRITVSSLVKRVLFTLNNSLASGTYKVVLIQGNKILTTKKLSIVELSILWDTFPD